MSWSRLLMLGSAALLPGVIFLPNAESQNQNSLVRLMRVEGSLGTEEPVKIVTGERPESVGFTLTGVRLEADSMGALTRFRCVLTIANDQNSRRIKQVVWRLSIYDTAVRSHNQDIVQSNEVNIYPGETAAASARFGAVLPDKMIVLFQLVSISLADGTRWTPATLCTLEQDLRSVSCKPR